MKIEPNSCSSPCVVKVLYHELLGTSVQLRGVQTDKQTRGFSVNSLNLTRGCSQVLFYFFYFLVLPYEPSPSVVKYPDRFPSPR